MAEILLSEGELLDSSRAVSEVGGQTSKPPLARNTVDEVIDAVAAGFNAVGTQAEGNNPGTSIAGGSAAVVLEEEADICPRTSRTQVGKWACTDSACNRVFGRFDNLRRHTVRFHSVLPDGTPAPTGLVTKLSEQVKTSDERCRKVYGDTAAASTVGPVVKSPKKSKKKGPPKSAVLVVVTMSRSQNQ